MRLVLSIAGLSLMAGQVTAADMAVHLQIPEMSVAEYHRPYVAFWVARPDHSVAVNLGVWYQQEANREGAGTDWLKDIRQWWRRIGRTLDLPIDGVSGATRPPGEYALEFSGTSGPLTDLAEGEYTLHVEATREVGGRELVRIPFTWAPGKSFEKTVSGTSELGTITLKLIP